MIHLPEWRVAADETALAQAAAIWTLDAVNEGGAHPAICLTGGSSPRGLYALLATPAYAGLLDWPRIHWFIGDERRAPLDSPHSNMGEAMRLLLDGRAPPDNVHPMPVAEAGAAAARAYERELREWRARRGDGPLFDLVLLGLGSDGHVASLFPGQTTLQEESAWVVPVDKPGLPPEIARLSLTLPALASCGRMLFLVSGAEKAPVVARLAAGEDLPGARARAIGRTAFLLDEAAAAELPRVEDPRLVLVMGASGAGKTTVGRALAQRLGFAFLDADDLHPLGNRAKLRAGAPLTDADRQPWLASLREEARRARVKGRDLVIACSALKEAYRASLLGDDPRAFVVHLRAAPGLLAERLARRAGHVMSPALLPDQLRTLEEPQPSARVLVVDASASVDALVADATAALERS